MRSHTRLATRIQHGTSHNDGRHKMQLHKMQQHVSTHQMVTERRRGRCRTLVYSSWVVSTGRNFFDLAPAPFLSVLACRLPARYSYEAAVMTTRLGKLPGCATAVCRALTLAAWSSNLQYTRPCKRAPSIMPGATACPGSPPGLPACRG